MDFVHLHLHSNFSILQSLVNVKDLQSLCEENDMSAVAITDTHAMFGFFSASTQIASDIVKPVLGCELRVLTPGFIEDDSTDFSTIKETNLSSIVILIKDRTGYTNLSALNSLSFFRDDAKHISPFVTFKELEKFSNGLICLTGGVNGPIGLYLKNNNIKKATTVLKKLNTIFENNLLIEIQRHGLEEEVKTEDDFLQLSKEFSIPLVATNNVMFKTREEYKAFDILTCIRNKNKLHEEKRYRDTQHHYFKSKEEMIELFKDIPEAIENTSRVAEKCNFIVERHPPLLPQFSGSVDEEFTMLVEQSNKGLQDKLEKIPQEEHSKYQARLDEELDIIRQTGFAGYFLIVADFMSWSYNRGILLGPGRGSGAGSLVAWSLLITHIDPIPYGLIFERFIHLERKSIPDFDIDFDPVRRGEVVDYVIEKYGEEKVSQVITFGRMQIKSAIRDVCRVLSFPYGLSKEICDMIPELTQSQMRLGTRDIIKISPDLLKKIDLDRDAKTVCDIAEQLDGTLRQIGVHAAGVIISSHNIREVAPLYRDASNVMPVVQFDMSAAEQVGLVKFDFLGLASLQFIEVVRKFIKKLHNIDIDIYDIPLDDEKTFQIYQSGDLLGIFQCESHGMTKSMASLKPDDLEGIGSMLALYRPGPMDLIPEYIDRKFKKIPVSYLHPKLEVILSTTYGIIIYQEQVMAIAKILAGYSLGEADMLRRAMGKKKPEVMAKEKPKFIEGCIKVSKMPEKLALEIFDLIEKFADYGFNKSHAIAYGLISYQTAFLKTHYRSCFTAANLSNPVNSDNQIYENLIEARKYKTEILKLDINESEWLSIPIDEKTIRLGFFCLKSIGENLIKSIIDERNENGKFQNFTDFCRRSSAFISKSFIIKLIKIGALESLNIPGEMLLANIDVISKRIISFKAVQQQKGMSLFADVEIDSSNDILGKYILDQNLFAFFDSAEAEYSLFGFNFFNSPLDKYRRVFNRNDVELYSKSTQVDTKKIVKIPAFVHDMFRRTIKGGKPAVVIVMRDAHGTFSPFTSRPELVDMCTEHMKKNTLVMLSMKARFKPDRNGGKPSPLDLSGFEALDDWLIDNVTKITLDANKIKTKSQFEAETKLFVDFYSENSVVGGNVICQLILPDTKEPVILGKTKLLLSNLIILQKMNLSIAYS
ncbi:MAG: DNA polymerase III subunit alpha [Alphaproteobacteria bacterium]|nr:DNA polymerase III subunit alpha [Alphaproteobacteria bacterium]MBL0717775.1 DNA polymerase III subunit alpha [Alphaproteobacteria bacterium]